jgi:hypothetical protein
MLEIVDCEKRSLIEVYLGLSEESAGLFFNLLQDKYCTPDFPENMKKIYNEMLRTALQEHLIPDIKKEIKEELI